MRSWNTMKTNGHLSVNLISIYLPDTLKPFILSQQISVSKGGASWPRRFTKISQNLILATEEVL